MDLPIALSQKQRQDECLHIEDLLRQQPGLSYLTCSLGAGLFYFVLFAYYVGLSFRETEEEEIQETLSLLV